MCQDLLNDRPKYYSTIKEGLIPEKLPGIMNVNIVGGKKVIVVTIYPDEDVLRKWVDYYPNLFTITVLTQF